MPNLFQVMENYQYSRPLREIEDIDSSLLDLKLKFCCSVFYGLLPVTLQQPTEPS